MSPNDDTNAENNTTVLHDSNLNPEEAPLSVTIETIQSNCSIKLVKRLDRFSWLAIIFQAFLTFLGVALSWYFDLILSFFWRLGLFINLLVMVSSRPTECSPWPWRVSFIISLIESAMNIFIFRESIVVAINDQYYFHLPTQPLGFLYIIIVAISMTDVHKIIRRDHQHNRRQLGKNSMHAIGRVFLILLPLTFFALQENFGILRVMSAADNYRHHTPYCLYKPDTEKYSTGEQYCYSKKKFSGGWGLSIPLFANVDSFLDFNEARMRDTKYEGQNRNLLGTTNTKETQKVTVHDYARKIAMKEVNDGGQVEYAGIFGYQTIVVTLLTFEVCVQAGRLTPSDLLTLHITFGEAIILITNSILVLITIFMSASSSIKMNEHHLFWLSLFFSSFFVLLFSLRCVSLKLLNQTHFYYPKRLKRWVSSADGSRFLALLKSDLDELQSRAIQIEQQSRARSEYTTQLIAEVNRQTQQIAQLQETVEEG